VQERNRTEVRAPRRSTRTSESKGIVTVRTVRQGDTAVGRAVTVAAVAGYSYDEIAQQLDASYATVNRQLVRGRAAIRVTPDGG
jgi:hypothetical protein